MTRDTPRFLIDTMLGRLAHWLRAMGYDTIYLGQADDGDLLRLVRRDGRLLLTRDVKLAEAAAAQGCLRAERLDDQLAEVIAKLGLAPPADGWLSRCLDCNTPVQRAARRDVRDRVPPGALALHDAFWDCPGCGKVYWSVDGIRALVDGKFLLGSSRSPSPDSANRDSSPPIQQTLSLPGRSCSSCPTAAFRRLSSDQRLGW